MRALVLSGGGNRGALQVGALQALLEHDIQPDFIVGCSAGALNAAFMAQDFSMKQVKRLAEIWRNTTKEDVYPGGRLTILWRILTGKESLYDNRNFYAFLQRNGTPPSLTFGDLPGNIPLYITATHLDTEQLHVFGLDPNDRVLDALMASTALPPLHPPWTVNGERFIDGGTVTPLPLRVAIELGAREIFALHIWEEPTPMTNLQRGVSAIINRSISTMLRLQAEHDLLLTEVAKRTRLHNIRLFTSHMPDINDWSQSDRLRAAGYAIARDYLANLEGGENKRLQEAISPLRRASRALARGWASLLDRRTPEAEPAPVQVE